MRIKEERDELQKLVNRSTSNATQNEINSEEDLGILQPEPLTTVNFEDLKTKCEREARTMIKNAISFMIPISMINENKYLKDKFKVDVMSLSGMIYQLRSNEVMQKALMEQINLGLTHPRYWEVYTGMSKSIGELNKQLLQTVEAIRSTYKGFKEDVQEKRSEAIGPAMNSSSGMLTTGDGSVVTRGTKELINSVKKIKNEKINGDNESPINDQNPIPDIQFDITDNT